MINKKYLTIGIVIIILIIVGVLVYTFLNSPAEPPMIGDEPQEQTSGELNSNSIKLTREEYQEIIFDYVSKTVSIEYYVNNLDKEGCLQLETKLLQDDCVNAVELTQKALQENNPAICENRAYKISERLRAFCFKKVFLESKNE